MGLIFRIFEVRFSVSSSPDCITSSGVAPNNETTWKLLQAKHPEGPLPMLPPVPTLAGVILPPDFYVLTILKSFSKATVCGPSGLHIQHWLNAAEVP